MMLRREPVQQNTPAQSVATGLQALYEATLPVVYRFIYSKVGNREEAEDLTSQVFIKAVRGLDEARDRAAAQAWLFQVARTTIADFWRAHYQIRANSLDDLLATGWDIAPVSGQPSVDHSAETRVQRILAQLPERYREVLTYRFLLNYSLKETAARMNLTEANIKVLQFRALKKASQITEPDDECEVSGEDDN